MNANNFTQVKFEEYWRFYKPQSVFCCCSCCCYCQASVMSDSVRPHRQQPTRLPRPWDSPGKNTGVGCHFLLQRMKVKSESEVSQCVRLVATPWTAAYQAPLSMRFSKQEYGCGLPLPSPKCLLTRYLMIIKAKTVTL